jgi:hypothetical protein
MEYDEQAAKEIWNNHEIIRNWAPEAIAIWLRDKCRCVYCDRKMLEFAAIMDHFSTIDHVLPKKKYPQFEWKPWNRVLACRRCNNLKRYTDPAELAGVAVGSDDPTEDEFRAMFKLAKELVTRRIAEKEDRFVMQKELLEYNLAKVIANLGTNAR